MGNKKVAIDTCVFLNLIDYNTLYRQNRYRELNELMREDELYYKESIKELNVFLDGVMPRFMSNYKSSFSIKQKLYYASSYLSIRNRNVPVSEIDNLSNYISMLKELKADYINSRNYAGIGELFVKMISGEIEVVITPTARNEIEAHKTDDDDPNIHRMHRPWEIENIGSHGLEKYAEGDIENLLDKCNIVEINDEKINNYISRLSLILRGKIGVDMNNPETSEIIKAMKDELNSQGIPADSLIMAEAIYMQLPLLTQNEKDFIYDEGNLIRNNNLMDLRRMKIIEIIKRLGKELESKPQTPEEFFNGEPSDSPRGVEETENEVSYADTPSSPSSGLNEVIENLNQENENEIEYGM